MALPAVGRDEPRLFSLRRQASYALTGSVQWRSADARRILLANAVPERARGQVVLSLHFEPGMRVSPSRVQLEDKLDSQDAISFVRLRMSEPVGRIMITWDSR